MPDVNAPELTSLRASNSVAARDYGSTSPSNSASSPRSRSKARKPERPSISVTPQDASSAGAATPYGRPVSFIAPVGLSHKSYEPTFKNKVILVIGETMSLIISSICLSLVVLWAMLADFSAKLPRRFQPIEPVAFPWEDSSRWKNEKCVKNVQYYAQAVGFDIVDEEVETDDGFYLRMHRVINPRHKTQSNGKGGYPVLVLHGLFQSSGAFITSEERSLAFWLSEHGGYQVFLGNTRGIFGMGHKHLSRGDPRFWNWTIRELALYDLPALVEYVCDVTGYDQIAFIGHSQGNGLAFLSLSQGMRPEIGERISCFIALAPAVFAGPLTHGFPFSILCRIDWNVWKYLFGTLDFIPMMRYAYHVVPAKPFALMGYVMFAYLFSWTDANWLKRRKVKIFRFTPTPVSSQSIYWWCGKGGFAERKCTMNDAVPQWFDKNFPPLAIYHGGRDFLVATEPLLERLSTKEPHVRLLKVEKLEMSEHCDFYLAADAVEWCFNSFIDDIEKTRPDIIQTHAPSMPLVAELASDQDTNTNWMD